MSTRKTIIIPSGSWPEAISDGLSLPCGCCHEKVCFDYTVTDSFWKEFVPQKLRLGVVCLPCLTSFCEGQLSRLSDALERVQFVADGITIILQPSVTYLYGTPPPKKNG